MLAYPTRQTKSPAPAGLSFCPFLSKWDILWQAPVWSRLCSNPTEKELAAGLSDGDLRPGASGGFLSDRSGNRALSQPLDPSSAPLRAVSDRYRTVGLAAESLLVFGTKAVRQPRYSWMKSCNQPKSRIGYKNAKSPDKACKTSSSGFFSA